MRRRVRGILFGVIIGLVGALFVVSPLGQALEETVGLAWLFRLRGPITPPAAVAVVAIDEQAAIELGVPKAPRDWPRSLHAHLIDALVAQGVDVIVFDLAFNRQQAPTEDDAFATAMARAQRVLLFETIERQIWSLGTDAQRDIVVERFTEPVAGLATAAMGVAPLPLPNVPARVNRFWSFLGQSDDRITLPALALLAYGLRQDESLYGRFLEATTAFRVASGFAARTGAEGRIEWRAQGLRQAIKTGASLATWLPSDGRGTDDGDNDRAAAGQPLAPVRRAIADLYVHPDSYYLNFYGPAGTIRHISYAPLLACGHTASGPCDLDLRGRVVFVGYSELNKPPDFARDTFVTVFGRNDGIYLSGVEIAATAFANLLSGTFLSPLPSLPTFALVLLLGLAFGLITSLALPPTAAPAAIVLALAYALTAQWLFADRGLWLPLATPVLGQMPLALIGGIGGQWLRARREERLVRQAKAVVDAASAAKSEALRMAGHDIRTPVQAILGYVEQIRATPLDATQQVLFDRMATASDALVGLLNGVLDLAAIEAGKLRIVESPTDPAAVVRTVVEMFQPQAVAKGLDLSLVVALAVPTRIKADPLRLQQVLGNLVANAVKFTDRGNIVVQLEVHHPAMANASSPAAVLLRFAVTDSGVGIAPELLPHLFEPFRRGEGPAIAKPGTGLGLSICQRLAALMGGHIVVASNPGVGSTFTFHLPAIALTGITETLGTAPSRSLAVATPGFAEEAPPPLWTTDNAIPSVLIVEDDAAIRAILERHIIRLGLASHSEADGLAARAWLATHTPTVIITDYRMPGLEGPDLIHGLRADSRFAALRIIGLTADAAAPASEAFLAAGADAVLVKPVTRDELTMKLRDLGIVQSEASQTASAPTHAAPLARPDRLPPPAASVSGEREDWPVFDPTNLFEAIGHDRERLAVVADVFCQQTAALIRGITTAAARRDAATLSPLAHRAAGSCLAFGAIRIGEACRTLEQQVKTEDWPAIDALVATLEPAFVAAETACRLATAGAPGSEAGRK